MIRDRFILDLQHELIVDLFAGGGGVPVSKQLRSLGWVVVRWASKVRPRVIMCENVAEWQDWGPVVNGQPCPRRKGRTFQQWVDSLRALGYSVEWRELRGQPYRIADIGMRMLTPRELFNAQGFPPGYRIDTGADGRPLTKTAQVRMCGNSVAPAIPAALVQANKI